MKFASIDIETTGLTPSLHQVLSVACVIGDTSTDTPIHGLPWKTWLVNNGDTIIGQTVALKMNEDLLGRIERAGTDPREKGEQKWLPSHVISGLYCFIREHAIPIPMDGKATRVAKGKLTPAGKNVARFDLPFLRYMSSTADLDDVLHRRTLDVGNLYLRPEDETIPDTDACIGRMLNERPNCPHPSVYFGRHDALADAMLNVLLIRHKLGGLMRVEK